MASRGRRSFSLGANSSAADCAGIFRLTNSQMGIHNNPRPPVIMNGTRQPREMAKPIQSAESAAPRLKPTWFTAAPKARSPGLRYNPFTLPNAGTPADSPIPSATRQNTSPPNPRTSPVPAAAADHQLTAAVIPRFTPKRSRNQPENRVLAA